MAYYFLACETRHDYGYKRLLGVFGVFGALVEIPNYM